MSDLFHKDVPVEFIQKVFRVMNANPHLIFQVLTKRSERLAEVWKELNWDLEHLDEVRGGLVS